MKLSRAFKTSKVMVGTLALVMALCLSCKDDDDKDSASNDNGSGQNIGVINESSNPVTSEIVQETSTGETVTVRSFGGYSNMLLLGNDRGIMLDGSMRVSTYSSQFSADVPGTRNIKTWYETNKSPFGLNNPFIQEVANIQSGVNGAVKQYVVSLVPTEGLYKEYTRNAFNSVELVSIDPTSKQDFQPGSGAWEYIRINVYYDIKDEATSEKIYLQECNGLIFDNESRGMLPAMTLDRDFFYGSSNPMIQAQRETVAPEWCKKYEGSGDGGSAVVSTVGFITDLRSFANGGGASRVEVVYRTDGNFPFSSSLGMRLQERVLSMLQLLHDKR